MSLVAHEAAKLAFEQERNLPFKLPLDLNSVNYTCAGKHERLLSAFRGLGVPARYRICWFHWRDLPLPASLIAIPHDDNSSHLYLEVQIDGIWRTLDATWDPGLASAFPIATWEDAPVAVPSYETLSPEESSAYLAKLTVEDAADDLLKHGMFFMAINHWFEQLRTQFYARNYLGRVVTVVVDRPLGSMHPKHGFQYPVNYGYLPNTLAPDGEGIDAYILGVDQPVATFQGRCIAIVHRLNDNDDKLIVVPEGTLMTDAAIRSAVHFQEQWFSSRIIRDRNQIY